MDNFQTDYNSTEKEINNIQTCLDEIKAIKAKNPSGQCSTQEYKMKQSSLKVRNQMNDLEVLS